MGRTKTNLSQTLYRVFISVMVVSLLMACAGGPTKIDSDMGIKGAPDWVNEGTQTVSDKKGRLIHGVGSAPHLGDQALQKSTADNRARAEIARVLSSYLNVMAHDYLASDGSGQDEDPTTDASIEQQINSVSKVVLNGSKILGNWRDKRTNIIYSFAELDLKRAKDIIKVNKNMSKGLKHYVEMHGDQVFDEFVTEK